MHACSMYICVCVLDTANVHGCMHVCVLPFSPSLHDQLCAVQFVPMGSVLLTTLATVLDSVGPHAVCQVAAQTHSMGCGAECIVMLQELLSFALLLCRWTLHETNILFSSHAYDSLSTQVFIMCTMPFIY